MCVCVCVCSGGRGVPQGVGLFQHLVSLPVVVLTGQESGGRGGETQNYSRSEGHFLSYSMNIVIIIIHIISCLISLIFK